MESNLTTRNRSRTENKPGQCTAMKPPQFGTLKIVTGNGTSVGTVMTLNCQITYKAFSGGQISCVQETNGTQWIGGTPECKPILYENQGFRLAVLLSIVSVAIIMLMGLYFITSCLLNFVEKEKMNHERQRNDHLWHQLNVEEQGHSFYNGNGRMTNNNNNNSNSTEEHPRSHQLNFPEPPSTVIQLSQPTLGQNSHTLLCR